MTHGVTARQCNRLSQCPEPAVVFGVPQAEAYLVYVAGIPTLCGVLAGLAETSAERPNRVGRVIGFLPVWGLDVDVECAVITGRYRMPGALDIRRVLRRG